jgi:hypothetical protein
VDALSFKQQDINLAADEIEEYLTMRGFPKIKVNTTNEVYEFRNR